MALLIPILFIGVMYFFLIRPQREQARQHAELVAGLESGDEVLTSSGIYGRIVGIDDDDDLEVEIADGVVVSMSRNAVMEVAVDEEDDDESEDDDVEPVDGDDVDVDGR